MKNEYFIKNLIDDYILSRQKKDEKLELSFVVHKLTR